VSWAGWGGSLVDQEHKGQEFAGGGLPRVLVIKGVMTAALIISTGRTRAKIKSCLVCS
jgi:hypothetical protein